MSQEDMLAVLGNQPLVKYTEEDAQQMLKSSFLPRLQVFGSSSDACKTERIPLGVWGVVLAKEVEVNLGKELDILVVTLRPKALQLKGTPDGKPWSYFDMHTADFKRVQAMSAIKDSGAMFGLEFLVWVPPAKTLATLYLGSFSARKEAPALLNEMKKDFDGEPRDAYGPARVTCRVKLASNAANQKYHVPQFFPCSSELSVMPNPDDLAAEVQKFNNPPAMEAEKDETATGAERAR